MGEAIAGREKIRVGATGGEAEEAGAFGEGPERVIGVMVPLPGEGERVALLGAREVIGLDDAGDEALVGGQAERVGGLSIGTEDGPVILPGDGDEVGDASDCAVVTEEVGEPLSVGGIDESALGDAFILEGDAAFVGAGDGIAAMDEDRAHASAGPGDIEKVIVAVDFEELGAFGGEACGAGGYGRGVGDDDLVEAVGLDAGEVGFEFDETEVAGAVEHVGAVVVVEEERVIVERGFQGGFGPGALFDVLGGVDVGSAGGAGEGCDVERALVVAEAAGPGAGAVAVFSVGEFESVDILEGIVGVAGEFPIDEVVGFHDGESRGHVHGGAAHVVGVANADHGHVGDIGMDDGVAGLTGCRDGE